MDTRNYLRNLAGQVVELAALPIMEERKKLWLAHNAGELTTPPVLMEWNTFEADFLPPLQCAAPLEQLLERQLLAAILNYQQIGDDKVITPEVNIPLHCDFRLFDLAPVRHAAADASGRELGYSTEYPLADPEAALETLRPSRWSYDPERARREQAEASELIGDLITVKIQNRNLEWFPELTAQLIELLGMENLFISSLECPEALQELLTRAVDDDLAFLADLEKHQLLALNNGNDYAGSGSYGFSAELPAADFSGPVRLCDRWGNLNSQETVGIAPEQFMRDFYPHYVRLAEVFGLVYYGCCEPLHQLWELGLKNLPHLRKVSCSPWCDDARMGEMLRGGKVVMCCKPSPNFIGVGQADFNALAQDIAATIQAARGCPLEFSFRDVYTLCGEPTRAKQAVETVRRIIHQKWRD